MLDHQTIDRDQARLNLLTSPYRILGINPTATSVQIEAAYAALLERIPAAENALSDAYAAILDPAQQLTYELCYPLDSSPAQLDLLYAALENTAPSQESLSAAAQLPPLSRANFLAEVASSGPAESTLLIALLDAHISTDVTAIYELLKTVRKEAASPSPSLVNVNAGLQQLFGRHAEAAIRGYGTLQDSLRPVLECTQHILATGEPYRIEALSGLLDAYRNSITELALAADEKIAEACATLKQQPDNSIAIDVFKDALERWIALYGPLILLTRQRRQPEPKLAGAIDRVRLLLADLSIEQKYPDAREIADNVRVAFGLTPQATEQFSHGVASVQRLNAEATTRSFHDLIEQLATRPDALVKALESNGFGRRSSQPARKLWKVFCRSIKTAGSPELQGQLWLAIRDLALCLADRPEGARAAAGLLAGLVRHGERTSLEPAILVSLRDGLGLIEKTHHVTVRAESHLLERYGRWLTFACGVLIGTACGAAAYRYFDTGSARSLVEPAGQVLQHSAAGLGRELIPPLGKDQHLALDYVRYCRFQEERLRIIKGLVQGADDARAFNSLANDYNSRCGNFYYLDDDLKLVMEELGAQHEALEAEAKHIVAAWPWRAGSGNPLASGPGK